MRKLIVILCIVVISGMFLFLVSNEPSDTTYFLSDFSEIIIDKSTMKDVSIVAPDTVFSITGKGSNCKIPLNDGSKLYIEFYGPNMIVSKKIIIPNSTVDRSTGDG